MEISQKNNSSTEDKLLYSRLDDMISGVSTSYGAKYLGFLNEREILLSKEYLKYMGIKNYLYFGGYRDALREVLAIHSDYAEPNIKDFLLSSVTFTFRKDKKLTHRDFLGTLLALQINRESLGDILVKEGLAVVFTYNHISQIIFNEVKKVGNEGVSLSEKLPSTLPAAFLYQENDYIVSSNRLDCYVASIANTSRSVASDLIKKEKVFLNHLICNNTSKQVEVGDIISIRGYGKYSLKKFLNVTKKGRQKVTINKYI